MKHPSFHGLVSSVCWSYFFLGIAPALLNAQAIGMVGDGITNSVVVFDADTYAVLGVVPLAPGSFCVGDGAIAPDRTEAYVVTFDDKVFVIDLTSTPPSLASGINPIPISNPGEDVCLTADGRFLIVSDGAAPKPLSVVDLALRTEVSTLASVQGWSSVDVTSSTTVLGVETNAGSPLRIHRLIIDSFGNLAYTGANLLLPDTNNVVAPPTGDVGFAVTLLTRRIYSFSLNSMTILDNRELTAPGRGLCAVRDDQHVYIRTDSGLEALEFSPQTGLFGASLWAMTTHYVTPCFGVESLAMHPDGTRLFFADQWPKRARDTSLGTALEGMAGVRIIDPATGETLHFVTNRSLLRPKGICIR